MIFHDSSVKSQFLISKTIDQMPKYRSRPAARDRWRCAGRALPNDVTDQGQFNGMKHWKWLMKIMRLLEEQWMLCCSFILFPWLLIWFKTHIDGEAAVHRVSLPVSWLLDCIFDRCIPRPPKKIAWNKMYTESIRQKARLVNVHGYPLGFPYFSQHKSGFPLGFPQVNANPPSETNPRYMCSIFLVFLFIFLNKAQPGQKHVKTMLKLPFSLEISHDFPRGADSRSFRCGAAGLLRPGGRGLRGNGTAEGAAGAEGGGPEVPWPGFYT